MKRLLSLDLNGDILKLFITFLFVSLSLVIKSQEVKKTRTYSKRAGITRTSLYVASSEKKKHSTLFLNNKDNHVVPKNNLINPSITKELPSKNNSVVKPLSEKQTVLKITNIPSAQKTTRKPNLKGGDYEDD